MPDVQMFDPNSFNYDTEAAKIKRQRDLATMLQQQAMQTPQTQTVPGGPNSFVVKQNWLQPLSRMLMGYLSGSMNDQADTSQNELDKHSSDALSAALTLNPAADRARAAQTASEANDEMLREQRRGQPSPQAAGETIDQTVVQPEVAQPSPVAPQPQFQATPIPPVAAALQKDPMPVSTMIQEAQKNADREAMTHQADPLARLLSGYQNGVPSSVPKLGGSAPQAPATPTGTAMPPVQMAPAPQAPVPSAMPSPTAQPVDPQVQALNQQYPIPKGQAEFEANMNQHPDRVIGDKRSAVEKAASEAQPTLADRLAQAAALGRSGPQGQAMQKQILSQITQPPQYQHVAVKNSDGSETIVQFDPTGRTPPKPLFSGSNDGKWERIDTPSGVAYTNNQGGYRQVTDGSGKPVIGPEGQKVQQDNQDRGAKNDTSLQSLKLLDTTISRLTSIDPETGKPFIDATTGLSGKISRGWNAATGIATKSSEASAAFEGVKSQLWTIGMQAIRDAGGGAGAANSDVEGARVQSMLGDIDPSKLGTEGLMKKMNEIRSYIQSRVDYYNNLSSKQGLPSYLPPRQPGAAPSQLNYGSFKGGQ